METAETSASYMFTEAEKQEKLAELKRYRRDLHRIPELDFDLGQTIAYVEDVLAPLNATLLHPCKSCVCAFFDLAGEGAPATAIRADMDALPVTEATGAAFASEHEGCMHACGHDTHMAMALATATYVNELLAAGTKTARNVLFVFQPAEETTGGAKSVCESGIFERYKVDRIFGFHVWPDLPAGTVASCAGPMLARSSETRVHITGASTHIAKTYGVADADSHNALLAAAKFLVDSHELVQELVNEEPCVFNLGFAKSGTVCNAVAGRATLAGSLRVFTDTMYVRAKQAIEEVLARSCEAFGCTYDISFAEGYPPVSNNVELFELAQQIVPGLATVEEPLLIAEDFAFYQRHLPGLFLLLGTGVPEGATNERDAEGCPAYATSALHADDFLFNEEILLKGLEVYRRLLAWE